MHRKSLFNLNMSDPIEFGTSGAAALHNIGIYIKLVLQ